MYNIKKITCFIILFLTSEFVSSQIWEERTYQENKNATKYLKNKSLSLLLQSEVFKIEKK